MTNGDFFFNDTAATEIYTLSLHDALPICTRSARRERDRGASRQPPRPRRERRSGRRAQRRELPPGAARRGEAARAREGEIGRAHVELQSRQYLVCRLLLEKKKNSIVTLAE